MFRKQLLAAALMGLLTTTDSVHADIAVVISADSNVTLLEHSEAINIFMGRFRRLPNGSVALPIDQSLLKARFYRALVNKNVAEINSYWARLVFSGQASPPQQAADMAEVSDIISHNVNALSYVENDNVPSHMRVLLVLDE